MCPLVDKNVTNPISLSVSDSNISFDETSGDLSTQIIDELENIFVSFLVFQIGSNCCIFPVSFISPPPPHLTTPREVIKIMSD